MDRKIQVMDEKTGVPFCTLRSGTYHFNDLYGNVRAEVWKPEQSRTFSHKALVFPDSKSCKAEGIAYQKTKNIRPPMVRYNPPPELQFHGVLRNGAAQRYHAEQLKRAVIEHDRSLKYGHARGGSTNECHMRGHADMGDHKVVGSL